jgi:hypothetical protein
MADSQPSEPAPAPSQPPSPAGYRPTNSTNASLLIGGGVSALLFVVLKRFGIDVDNVSAAAIGAGISAAIGYFFEGGRK